MASTTTLPTRYITADEAEAAVRAAAYRTGGDCPECQHCRAIARSMVQCSRGLFSLELDVDEDVVPMLRAAGPDGIVWVDHWLRRDLHVSVEDEDGVRRVYTLNVPHPDREASRE